MYLLITKFYVYAIFCQKGNQFLCKYYRNTLTTVPDVSIQTKWFWFFYSEKALIVNLSNIF